MRIAQKITKLRLRRGWSQRALARELNARGVTVSQRAVSGWEEGAEPRPEMVAALASLFGVSTELLTDEKQHLPLPTDSEIIAASDTPVDTETAQRLSERIGGVAERIRAFAESHPKAETVAQVIVIEELESLLGHAQGLVESLERIKSRLTATAGREPKPKKPLIVPAPPHHRNPRQPGEGGGSAASA